MSRLKASERESRTNYQLKFFGKKGFHSTYSMIKPRIRVKCKVKVDSHDQMGYIVLQSQAALGNAAGSCLLGGYGAAQQAMAQQAMAQRQAMCGLGSLGSLGGLGGLGLC